MLSKKTKTILPIIWMGIIFYLSHQPYEFFVIESTNPRQITAHIFLYAILAYLLIITVLEWRKSRLRNVFLFSVFFSIIYGISDEYHQGFIPGRTVSSLDVVMDMIGAVIGSFLFLIIHKKKKPKLLLHTCCMGCGSYVVQKLKKDFNVVLYFYNPNIFPREEYDTRFNETKKIAKKFKLKLIIGNSDHKKWLDLVKGFEGEPERGRRCVLCYNERLKETARKAEEMGFEYFTTTLTISPHKDADVISELGNDIAKKYHVIFYDKDFKEEDGFKKSCVLSKELGLYRQNYCGCEFSIRGNKTKKKDSQ